MKFKKILLGLVAIISTLFVATVKADSAPNSFVINGSSLKMLYGSNYLGNGSTLNFTYKTNSAGKVVYCTEIHDTMTSGSETYTLSKAADAKFAYVLANGYPNKSITGNNYKDYYITGLALWYLISPNDSVFTYFNLSAGTYKGVSSEVVREVAKLVNAAKNYSYVTPTIKIQNATSNFTLSSDKKYYVSNKMSVSTTGGVSTYFMSLTDAPAGSIITDVNGNAKTDTDGKAKSGLSVGEAFYVKVPVASMKSLSASFTLNVSGTGNINTAYIYNPSVASHQSLITLYPQSKTVADHAPLKLEITTSVEISKQDATTGEELPGATLVLTNASGTEVAKWVSTSTPKVIKNLTPGKYTLSETAAPKGFKVTTETITFEIKADGTTTKQVMKNYPDGKTTISKQDATTGKELPGATLVLTYPNGKTTTWVSTSTPKVFTNLPAGKYILTETIAPKGYILSEEKVTFTVDKDGNVAKPVVMKNYPEGKTSISKQDATTGKELPGATLVLTDEKGKEIDKWISTNEPHLVENLKPGKYTLTETIAPEGFRLSSETVEFTVSKDGKVQSKVVMKNYPLGVTVISKQDITTKEELYGAHLEVRNEKGDLIESWTSGKEPHKIEGLEPGKYTLIETQAPDGYILSKETIEFEVDEKGQVKDIVVMYNERIPDVPVPKTSSFKTITTTLIGLLTMVLGALVIQKNYKKNEEK